GESGDDKVTADDELQSLVKGSTAELADAIDTGHFSKLYENSSKDFQSTYTLAQTKDAYKTYIDNKDQVLPSLRGAASGAATFSPPASIRSEKGLNILVASGAFVLKPHPVHLDYEEVSSDGA